MKDIELIEKYLMHELEGPALELLERRLQDDPPFRKLAEEFRLTLDSLKRRWLRVEIAQVQKQVLYRKLLVSGIIAVAVLVSLWLMLKSPEEASEKIDFSIPYYKESTQVIPGHPADMPVPMMQEETADSPIHRQGTFTSTSFTLLDSNLRLPDEVPVPLVQQFIVNNTRDTVIHCTGGTSIMLAANTLITESGKGSLETVEVSIKEFSNYYDMWQHGITTTSGGNLLESGGSCYIAAKCEGEHVSVMKGESFLIEFDSPFDQTMSTFYGLKDSLQHVDWQNCDPVVPVTAKDGAINNRIPLKISDTVFYLEPIISDEARYKSINGYRFDLISRQNDLRKVFDTLSRFPSNEAKKIYIAQKSLQFRFGVDSAGRINKYDYNFILPKKSEKQLKQVAQHIVNTKVVNKRNLDFETAIINVNLKPLYRIEERDTSIFLDSNLSKVQSIPEKQRIYNAIVSSAFGYVNCDAFYKAEEWADISIITNGYKPDTRVFFREFNSVVQCTQKGDRTVFHNAPKGAPVLLVSTFQYKGMLMMCMQEAKVGEEIILSDAEPFDLVKLKYVLLHYRTSL
jgi:hypothetical protein